MNKQKNTKIRVVKRLLHTVISNGVPLTSQTESTMGKKRKPNQISYDLQEDVLTMLNKDNMPNDPTKFFTFYKENKSDELDAIMMNLFEPGPDKTIEEYLRDLVLEEEKERERLFQQQIWDYEESLRKDQEKDEQEQRKKKEEEERNKAYEDWDNMPKEKKRKLLAEQYERLLKV